MSSCHVIICWIALQFQSGLALLCWLHPAVEMCRSGHHKDSVYTRFISWLSAQWLSIITCCVNHLTLHFHEDRESVCASTHSHRVECVSADLLHRLKWEIIAASLAEHCSSCFHCFCVEHTMKRTRLVRLSERMGKWLSWPLPIQNRKSCAIISLNFTIQKSQ